MSEPSPPLMNWIEQAIGNHLQQAAPSGQLQWQNLSGDAGFRQYFRLNTLPPTLAVVAPPETENNAAFIAVADYLRERGIRTPAVIAYESDRGFMLVEDLGRDLLLDHLNADTVDLLYGEALMLLLRLQQQPPNGALFPIYSRQKLRDEMNSFSQWFAEGLLGYTLTQEDRQIIDPAFQCLEDSAASQPQVIAHRDFHSRNLVYAAGSAPGVIDFQDAVTGPLTYDLVSLLRDCYIQWPQAQVERWALAYAGMAADVGLLQDVSDVQFLRWFDYMGLQRHIKVLGVFSRLSLRDGKHGYLADLPLVIHYVRSLARQYGDTRAFADWFEARLLPLARQQAWYTEVRAKPAPVVCES
jgi:aminoglycoside/choline kinase family phosphotransferase